LEPSVRILDGSEEERATGVSTQPACRADARTAEPHKRLMAAVLCAVVDDYQGVGYQRRSGRRRATHPAGVREAIAYVASTDREWPFSFENLCDALGIDPGCVRQELHRELSV
jgi:hypothetical protein